MARLNVQAITISQNGLREGLFFEYFWLVQYIETTLFEAGYIVPFNVCEDFGWLIQVKLPVTSFYIACLRLDDENRESDFVCSIGGDESRVWSWSKFRFVDISKELESIHRKLSEAFTSDPEIELLADSGDPPVFDSMR
ncbi:MAG: hypothetical protein AAF585_10675, partial [Verrucomicrobiota bacterium]